MDSRVPASMKLSLRTVSPLAALALVFVTGCSKLSSGESGATKTTSASSTSGALGAADIVPALTKAGWTITSNDLDDQDGWPSRYVKLEKGADDNFRSATMWIDALGEPSGKQAKPTVEIGKGALIRFAMTPSSGKAAPFDVAAFAKDIVAVTPPEKATDGLFNSSGYDGALKKHGLSAGSTSGGRVSPGGVVFNHRAPMTKDSVSVAVEIVHFQKGLDSGAVKLLGTTLVTVTGDAAAQKEIFATIAK